MGNDAVWREPELKRCPLCRGFAMLDATNPNIRCDECGCEVWADTVDEAIAKWNRRDGCSPIRRGLIRSGWRRRGHKAQAPHPAAIGPRSTLPAGSSRYRPAASASHTMTQGETRPRRENISAASSELSEETTDLPSMITVDQTHTIANVTTQNLSLSIFIIERYSSSL